MTGECRRFRVRGRVQGVGFRAWLRDEAERLGLSGWVRNRHDGSVEAVLAGESGALDGFAALCRAGPSAARVDALDIEACPDEPIPKSGVSQRPTG